MHTTLMLLSENVMKRKPRNIKHRKKNERKQILSNEKGNHKKLEKKSSQTFLRCIEPQQLLTIDSRSRLLFALISIDIQLYRKMEEELRKSDDDYGNEKFEKTTERSRKLCQKSYV